MTTMFEDTPLDVDEDAGFPDQAEPEINPKTGRPYTKSPDERKAWGEAMAEARRNKGPRPPGSAGAPKRRATPNAPASGGKGMSVKAKRTIAAQGLVQIPAILLGMLGKFVPAFFYDSCALTLHGPAVADALVLTADSVPAMAELLDKAGKIGPYGALATAMTPLIMQIAANHKVVPEKAMGTMSRDELHATVAPESYAKTTAARAQAQAQAEEEAAYADALPDAA